MSDQVHADYIIYAANKLINKINRNMPKTKSVTKSLDVTDINPHELHKHLQSIPKQCHFTSHSQPSPHQDNVFVIWQEDEPLTEEEKEEYTEKKFNVNLFKYIYETVTKAGYKRVSAPVTKPINAYKMYKQGNYRGLQEYYSNFFVRG